MSTVLPGSPPAFNKNDVEGTVKNLCAYTRNQHETLDYILGQFKRDFSKLQAAIEEQSKNITTLQTALAETLQLMNEQYTELNARVTALESRPI